MTQLWRVAAGQLGKKSGQGFYRWEAGKARKAVAPAVPEGLARRILAPLGHEAIPMKEAGISIEPEETGTTFAEHPDLAWHVDFAAGLSAGDAKTTTRYARCVRTGPLRAPGLPPLSLLLR